MSSKKEEKAQAAAERIKAAALSAAKGLSRAQAERAATAAARNVNAYGQKEEGPSRWQERKEAKRQMYLMSTEKAVKLGVRKDTKAPVSGIGGASSQCQKCFQTGHWTYECKNERVYISRPSRSQQLKNPTRTRIVVSFEGNPDVERMAEADRKDKGLKDEKKRRKRKHRSRSDSGSDTSEASVFESESPSSGSESEEYSSSESSSSYSSSDSGDKRRNRRNKRRKQKKRRHHRHTSSSESSESESASDSDSSGREDSRRKARRRNRRH